MIFALLTFIAAFAIEAIGTYISILGLTALFAGSVVVLAMIVALDIGKLVTVSFLYKNWSKINFVMKTYMTIASIVLIMITSVGVFGFLSGEFQKAIVGNNQQNITITALVDEQSRLQKRKEEIDKQIAQLPPNYVSGRKQLIAQFKGEVTRLNNRLAAIDEELPKLKTQNIEKAVKIGPILYIAEAFNTTPEIAAKWVILIIIGVFDPLAIALLLSGNFLLEQRRKKKEEEEVAAKVAASQPPPSHYEPAPEAIQTPPPTQEVEGPNGPVRVARRPWGEPSARVVQVESKPAEVVEHPKPQTAPDAVAVVEQSPIDTLQGNLNEGPSSHDGGGRDTVSVDSPPRVKLRRAALEDAPNGADVRMEFSGDTRHSTQIQQIVSRYAKDDIIDERPAVMVGGPPTRS